MAMIPNDRSTRKAGLLSWAPDLREATIAAVLLLPLGLDTFALSAALGVAALPQEDRLRVTLLFTVVALILPARKPLKI